MRTITAEQRRTLEDLSAQGLLGGLPYQTAEKDIHVTDVLHQLSGIDVSHTHFEASGTGSTEKVDDGIQLVFAGGTCLSKAHRLIDRMSEDIDIKVILAPPSRPLKAHISHRARLKALHAAIEAMLAGAGFELPDPVDGRKNPHVRDLRRYYAMSARYRSDVPLLGHLRPELKLEVIHRHPRLAVTPVSFGYLHERLAGMTPSKTVTIPCVHVAETLAEKVLSLLRRCHWKWSGLQDGELDPALVRHVYDVHRIVTAEPQQLRLACSVFAQLVSGDAEEFRGRDPVFEAQPRSALSKALMAVKESQELRTRYAERLLPLIFEGAEVEFSVAFASFEAAAQELLAQL